MWYMLGGELFTLIRKANRLTNDAAQVCVCVRARSQCECSVCAVWCVRAAVRACACVRVVRIANRRIAQPRFSAK